MDFRYKYEHLDCAYCADFEGKHRCPRQQCLHIMDVLDDLSHDRKFRKAVRNAERCNTPHKPTLLLLQKQGLQCPV